MASKNIFAVLKKDESDDEDQPKRQTKHEQRADDKQKRQATGDHVQKNNFYKQNHESRPEKNTYGGEGKRQYDRASGTGQNAFNKHEKKGGGGGKGNWGKADLTGDGEEKKAEGDAKAEATNDQPEEPTEPVLTLDDYMKENAVNLNTKLADNEGKGNTVTKAEKGFKVLKPKEADWVEPEQKSKNIDNISKSKTNQIEGLEPTGYKRGGTGGHHKGKGGNKKASELKNDDFPALG